MAPTANKKSRDSNRGSQKGNDGDRQPNLQRDTTRSREVSAGNQPNHRTGAGKSQSQNANGPLSLKRSTSKRGDMTMATAQDENVVVGGFDATAMRASLRKVHDATAEVYKPVAKTTTSRATAPWASKRKWVPLLRYQQYSEWSSEHHGQRQGLLPRTSQAGYSIATNWRNDTGWVT
jgi:hypothetical protein